MTDDATLPAVRLGELEALLYAASRPISTRQLARLVGISEQQILSLLDTLKVALDEPSRGLQLRESAGSWRLETKTIHGELVASSRRGKGERPLSQQALETLAVVALRQPVTTDEVSAIRGVESAATLATLHKRKLIAQATAITTDSSNKRVRWRTTQGFLDLFGLGSLQDLYNEGRLATVFGPLRNPSIRSDTPEH